MSRSGGRKNTILGALSEVPRALRFGQRILSGRPDRRRARRDSVSITRLPSLEAARDIWTELADQQDNVFATWEWASIWWQHFGGSHEPFVHVVGDSSGRPIGILPLYVSAKRLGKVARFIGHGPADQLGPVCAAEHREVVAAALRVVMDAPHSPRILLAERLRADHGWTANLRGKPIRRHSFPLLELDHSGWESWLATRSANFRQQTRKAERRLARDHRLEYRLITDEDDVPGALDAMIELHDARWEGDSEAFSASRRAFHHDFALAAARRGWLRIWFADVDDRPVAAWLGYRFNDVESSYLMGRAPAWSDRNVGAILRMHTVREASSDVREYRLLSGNEPYKRRLTAVDPTLETSLVGRGLVPQMAQAVVRNKRFLPAPARRILSSQIGL